MAKSKVERDKVYDAIDYDEVEAVLREKMETIRNSWLFRYNSHLLHNMMEGNLLDGRRLRVGSNIEIILADDAVWDTGHGPVGSADMHGYDKMNPDIYDNNWLRPANRITARVHSIDLNNGKLILASAIPSVDALAAREEHARGHDLGMFYMKSTVMRDYRILD